MTGWTLQDSVLMHEIYIYGHGPLHSLATSGQFLSDLVFICYPMSLGLAKIMSVQNQQV